MRPMRWLACVVLLACSQVVHAADPTTAPAARRVLFVGNSLVYTNNVPGLLRAIAASQPGGPAIGTASFVAPGGTLAERWEDGAAAGALRTQSFDVLVLQEQGGLLLCMADPEQRQGARCRASQRAHRAFASLAESRGVRVLLFGTWAPDAMRQQKLDEGLRAMARASGGEVLLLGTWLRGVQGRNGIAPVFADDGSLHPTVTGSLLLAARLYAAIAGHSVDAQPLRIDVPLLPPNAAIDARSPVESQAAPQGGRKGFVLAAQAVSPLYAAANADD